MEFKSFMEALKGKQHKIDKNKNGKVDAHDFELLRKEESELNEGTADELGDSIDNAKSTENAKSIIAKAPTKHLQYLHHWNMGLSGARTHKDMPHIKAELTSRKAVLSNAESSKRFDEQVDLNEVSDEAKSLANDIASKHKNMKVSVERGNVMIHHKDDDEKIDRLTLSHTGNNKFHLHRTGSSTEDESHRNLTADEVHKHAAKHIGGLQESEELDEIHRMKTKLNKLDPISNRSVARQKLSNLMKSGKARGALIANKMRTLNMGDDLDQEDLDALYEVLSKDAKAGDWISDFVYSTNPKFDGKSKKERINMALGSYYDTHKKKDGVSEGYYEKPASAYRRKGDEVRDPTPVAPVPDRKYIKGTPENKALKASRKPINGMPTEEVEQIDEISKATLGSYVKKAATDARINSMIGKDFEHKAKTSRKPSMKDASTELSTQYKSKAWKRSDNIAKAVDRLTKEEVEQIDELKMSTVKSYHSKRLTDFSYANKKSGETSTKPRNARIKKVSAGIDRSIDRQTGYKPTSEETDFALRNEDKMTTTKDKSGKLVSFKYEGDWKKSTEKKEGSGKAANLAGQAMQTMSKANKKFPMEEVEHIAEVKDEQEYGYEGDMALNQLATLTRCAEMIKEILKPDTDMPEWVQSKITLATDYIQTAADYMHSEMNEAKSVTVKVNHAGDAPHEEKWEPVKKIKKPVEEAVQKVDIPAYLRKAKGDTPLKMDDLKRKDTISDPENLKKNRLTDSFDNEGNLISNKVSYKDFINEIKLADLPVRRIQGHSYGANYSDPEGADDYDDKKPMKPAAEKRGRGRPAGAKSGARKITGTSKLMNK